MHAYERRAYEMATYKRHAYEMAYERCMPMGDTPMGWSMGDILMPRRYL
jgi:hypothetical protein